MYGNHYLLKRLFYICFNLNCYILPVVMAIAAVGVGVAQMAVGAAQAAEAKRARQAAAAQMKEAALQKLSYAAELDSSWKENFGDTTAQTAKYYKELTGESLRQQIELSGNKALQDNYQNFQNQMKQLDTKINQMGMQNSSQALSALMQMSSQQMANNAAINFETQMNKMKTDQQVAEQKLAYNQTGNWIKQAAIDTKNQVYNMQFQAAQVEAGMAQSDLDSANQTISSGMNTVASGMNMAADWGTRQAEFNNKLQLQQNGFELAQKTMNTVTPQSGVNGNTVSSLLGNSKINSSNSNTNYSYANPTFKNSVLYIGNN